MRKSLVFLAAAASAVAVAAPASAQYYGGYIGNGYNNSSGYNNGYGYNSYGNNRSGGYGDYGSRYQSNQLIAANRERMARIHNEIDQAVASGRMSRGEAAALHRQAAQFDRELAYLARGGMTGQEGAIFDQRADRLAQEVRARSGYGYGYGYGNNRSGYDGYGYDGYGRR
ncbi:MAG TPA: hypothetical protein VN640_06975 [Sphingomicrobium sp.]|nr:hypothetical protein [Sphingomicrobium sp.]